MNEEQFNHLDVDLLLYISTSELRLTLTYLLIQRSPLQCLPKQYAMWYIRMLKGSNKAIYNLLVINK